MENVKRDGAQASVRPQPDIDNLIIKEKHHLFIEEVRSRMLFSFLLSCGIGLYFYQQTTIENLFIWLSTLCVAALNSLFLLKNSNRDKTHQHQWKHIYLAVIWGIHWGSIPLIFLSNADLVTCFTVFTLILISCSMPSITMAVYPGLYITFLTPVFLALTYGMANALPEEHKMATILPILSYLMLLLFSRMTSRQQTELIRLRILHKASSEENAQLHQEKSRALTALSHDIKQPIQAIHLYSAALLAQKNTPEQITDTLEKIAQTTNTAKMLIDEAANAISGNTELSNLLNQLIGNYKIFIPDSVQIRHLGCPEIMEHHAVHVRKILNNAMHNASRFTPSGVIVVKAKLQPNGLLKITIADSGVGIKRDHLKKVRQKGVTTDIKNGSGMGLSVIEESCQMINARYSLRSKDGKGTIFSLFINCKIANK